MDTLERARALSERLVAARRQHRQAEHTLARLLAEMDAGSLHRALGYATVGEYAAAALDLPPRHARDLLRIGRRLPTLPALDAALAAGELDWTKAREIVTVATPDTDAAWVDRARQVSCRALERDVAASHVGQLPPEAAEDRAPARVRWVVQLERSELDLVLQALAVARARCDLGPDEVGDGTFLAAGARRYLEEVAREEEEAWPERGAEEGAKDEAATGPEAAPTAPEEPNAGEPERDEDPPHGVPMAEPYRIVLEHCPTCRHTAAPDAEVSDTVAAEARCDAEVIDLREGPNRGRASRAIPPAVRRAVLHRDGWRCAVPHCGNRLWLQLHHLDAWARGGRNTEENLVSVCSCHHRAVHEGVLALERDGDGCLVVRHADGRCIVGRPRGRARGRPRAA